MTVLDLLGGRDARRGVPEDPDAVRVMPMVLRIDRMAPPERTPLLEAAAAAALAVCLDPRAEPGGQWYPEFEAWVSGRIRKVTRRARGAQWDAVGRLPGVTVERAGAQVRALVPCRVADTPREVARLQIAGTDLPADRPGPAPADQPVLWVNPEVPMSVGKAAAQVGHATMLLAAALPTDQLADWAAKDFRCAVRTAEPADWALLVSGDGPVVGRRERRTVAVRDAGFTEVAPGTVTVVAQWR